MPTAWKVCSTPGCPTAVPPGSSRCESCKAEADTRRGTARERGYDERHRRRFRDAVLRRDPLCVCVDTDHAHAAPCNVPSTVADHYPRSRRELVAVGLNPNDRQYGRGICKPCHDRRTAVDQPGGWNAR